MYFSERLQSFTLINSTGSHPSTADDIVNRTVCVTGINGYCDYKYPIQIKACADDDFVYFLRKTDACNEGYCFGEFY